MEIIEEIGRGYGLRKRQSVCNETPQRSSARTAQASRKQQSRSHETLQQRTSRKNAAASRYRQMFQKERPAARETRRRGINECQQRRRSLRRLSQNTEQLREEAVAFDEKTVNQHCCDISEAGHVAKEPASDEKFTSPCREDVIKMEVPLEKTGDDMCRNDGGMEQPDMMEPPREEGDRRLVKAECALDLHEEPIQDLLQYKTEEREEERELVAVTGSSIVDEACNFNNAASKVKQENFIPFNQVIVEDSSIFDEVDEEVASVAQDPLSADSAQASGGEPQKCMCQFGAPYCKPLAPEEEQSMAKLLASKMAGKQLPQQAAGQEALRQYDVIKMEVPLEKTGDDMSRNDGGMEQPDTMEPPCEEGDRRLVKAECALDICEEPIQDLLQYKTKEREGERELVVVTGSSIVDEACNFNSAASKVKQENFIPFTQVLVEDSSIFDEVDEEVASVVQDPLSADRVHGSGGEPQKCMCQFGAPYCKPLAPEEEQSMAKLLASKMAEQQWPQQAAGQEALRQYQF